MSESPRKVRVSSSALYREVQGEAVLLQLDNGEYFGLDEVATRIWQLLVANSDLDAVRDALVNEYDVAEDEATNDLTRLVDELISKHLLEVDDVAPH
jgi:Coenzyme PQQ synthesis protein D (PqqD)